MVSIGIVVICLLLWLVSLVQNQVQGQVQGQLQDATQIGAMAPASQLSQDPITPQVSLSEFPLSKPALDSTAVERQGSSGAAFLKLSIGVVLGIVFVVVSVLYLLRQLVLKPINEVQLAVDSRHKNGAFSLPELAPDQIGHLAQALNSSYADTDLSLARLQVVNSALEGSSNEVFIVEVATMGIVHANKAGLDNLGYSLDDVLKMSVFDVAIDLKDTAVSGALAEQLAQKQEISYIYTHRRADGTTYPFEFKAMQVNGPSGELLLTLGNDVSDRLIQEEALLESQRRMAMALEGAQNGIFDIDLTRETVFLSDHFRPWMDIGDGTLSFDEFIRKIDPRDSQNVIDTINRARSNAAEFNIDFRVPQKNPAPTDSHEQIIWLQARGRASAVDERSANLAEQQSIDLLAAKNSKRADSVAESASALRLSGFVSDITRRKVAENLLQTTITRLGAVLDHIADGIVTLDERGNVCTVNPAAMTMFGLSKKQFAGYHLHSNLRLSEVVGESGINHVEYQLSELPEWRQIADGLVREAVASRADGSVFAAEITAMRMDLVSDERYTVVIRDISSHKQHEMELREAIRDAQAATEAKARFLATMSHEIRTPMNGVLGMTQLLLDMGLDVQQKETAQLIFSSGDALLTLINDILDFSKIEAGHLELEQLPFDFSSAIAEVMELLAANARSKSLDLYVDYPDHIQNTFVGDIGRIRQILLNLIGNAIKFTEIGHVILKIEDLHTNVDSTELRIGILDTGPGIKDIAPGKLFSAFTQADASTTRKFGGTGLGLAICKQLVELMGGEIGAASLQEGSEFWFTLNLPHADTPIVERGQMDLSALEGRRLLAVDDNLVGLQIVRRMSEEFGMTVVCCANPQDVPELIEQAHQHSQPFDIVALDYNMPGTNGLTVATNLRVDPRNAQTKVVLLTSSDVKAPSGLDGYALKPVMKNALARLFAEALFKESKVIEVQDDKFEHSVVDGIRVLLAEDNPVNQKVAVRMLEKLGCVVDVAANGREAVEMWHNFPYSMVFMDCQMPEMDGFTATRKIRSLEMQNAGKDKPDSSIASDMGGSDRRAQHTPIVAMTANAMAQDREDCIACGMDDYASKPIKLDLLQDMLVRWAEGTSVHLPG